MPCPFPLLLSFFWSLTLLSRLFSLFSCLIFFLYHSYHLFFSILFVFCFLHSCFLSNLRLPCLLVVLSFLYPLFSFLSFPSTFTFPLTFLLHRQPPSFFSIIPSFLVILPSIFYPLLFSTPPSYFLSHFSSPPYLTHLHTLPHCSSTLLLIH